VVVPFIPSPVRASPAVPGFEAPEKRFPGGPIIFGAQLQSEAPAGLAFQARKLWDPDVLHRARPSPPDLAPAALAPRSPLHAGFSSFCCSRAALAPPPPVPGPARPAVSSPRHHAADVSSHPRATIPSPGSRPLVVPSGLVSRSPPRRVRSPPHRPELPWRAAPACPPRFNLAAHNHATPTCVW
jgi:hypothetical protein